MLSFYNQSQSNVHIFILSNASVGGKPCKIQNDDDIEYVMVVTTNRQRSTKLYVTKSHIKGRDNYKMKRVHEKKREDYSTYNWTQP